MLVCSLLRGWLLIHTRECRHPLYLFPRDIVTPGRYVPLRVDSIKREVSKVNGVAVALIGLPLFAQPFDNPECLDGVGKGNPRPAAGLQFIALDPQPNRVAIGRAIVRFPVGPLPDSLLLFPRPLRLCALFSGLFPLLDCLALCHHAR